MELQMQLAFFFLLLSVLTLMFTLHYEQGEDEMVGWHHQLNGYEFEQALGDGEGQGSLACCSPWGRIESDTTEQLNNNK